MYNFKRLIAKYGVTPVYHVTQSGGFYDYANGGVWVDGEETETQLDGAVLQLRSDSAIFDENGVYSADDRALYVYADLDVNDTVRHKSKDYTVVAKMDYSDYDVGLFIYHLARKGVSS